MPEITANVFMFGKSQSVTVDVTSSLGFTSQDETAIIETVLGLKELHQTARSRGAPIGMIGYIHNYSENTILAVTAMDSNARTITIPKSGEVKSGNHVFK